MWKRNVCEELAGVVCVLVIWTWCLAHQAHLMISRQLNRLEGHFASLARKTNACRIGNAAKFFAAWKRLFGLDRAKEVASRLPPRPLKGRWGSVHANASHWLKCGKEQLCMVWEEVFPPKPVASKRRKKDGNDDDTDDDGPEAFQRRKSKWERLSWRDVHDDEHWIRMSAAHAARGPTMVFTFWLQKVVNGVAINKNCEGPKIEASHRYRSSFVGGRRGPSLHSSMTC